MAFLTLMGIPVPTSASSNGTIEPVRAGEYGRSFGLKPYSAVRAESRDYRGSTPFMARRSSLAYQFLLAGAGQAFPFDAAGSGSASDWFSTKGWAPDSGVTIAGISSIATGGPVGNGGNLKVSLGSSLTYVFPASPLMEATLHVWTSEDGFAWTHLVQEYSGTGSVADEVWNAGTPGGGTSPVITLSLSTSAMTMVLDGSVAEYYFAEVMVLPFRASLLRSDWADYMYNVTSGRAVADLPYLPMGGTWVPPGDSSQTDEVLGEVMGQRLVDTVVGGTPVQYEAFDFTLRSRNVR
jgi:hypothetical protein